MSSSTSEAALLLNWREFLAGENESHIYDKKIILIRRKATKEQLHLDEKAASMKKEDLPDRLGHMSLWLPSLSSHVVAISNPIFFPLAVFLLAWALCESVFPNLEIKGHGIVTITAAARAVVKGKLVAPQLSECISNFYGRIHASPVLAGLPSAILSLLPRIITNYY